MDTERILRTILALLAAAAWLGAAAEMLAPVHSAQRPAPVPAASGSLR